MPGLATSSLQMMAAANLSFHIESLFLLFIFSLPSSLDYRMDGIKSSRYLPNRASPCVYAYLRWSRTPILRRRVWRLYGILLKISKLHSESLKKPEGCTT